VMGLYPVLVNMEGKTAAVVGGGEVALRKINDLLEAGARVRVISPRMHERIEDLARSRPREVDLIRREYREGDLDGALLAFAAADDTAVNRRVFEEAGRRGIFVNAVDDPPNCTFYVPSFIRKGDLILAVSTGGASPAYAARVRRMLENSLPGNIEAVLEAMREARMLLQTSPEFSGLTSDERGEALRRIAHDDSLIEGLIRARSEKSLEKFLKSLL
jgi:precorrin-2 dehydrogenase/sirohydrochlorin ferrochelatase